MRLISFSLACALILTAAVVQAAVSINIEQKGQVFDQSSIELSPGDRLTFVNHDDVTHNISVFDETGETSDLGLQKPGVPLTYKFDKVGLFKVRCSIHPSMKMVVTVR